MQHVVDTALPLLLRAFDTDDDKEAVTAAVLGCGVILTGAGPHSCQKFMEPMATGSSMVRAFSESNLTDCLANLIVSLKQLMPLVCQNLVRRLSQQLCWGVGSS